MDGSNRSSIRFGLVLIFLGIVFFLVQFVPSFRDLFNGQHAPDLVLFAIALFLAIIGVVTAAPGMAIPVCILGGIGGIFFWQTVSGIGYDTWSYMWTLIPGFVGIGILLSEILSGRVMVGVSKALSPIAVSAVLFLIFASAFGGLGAIGPYWPVLLIVLGIFLILRPFILRNGR